MSASLWRLRCHHCHHCQRFLSEKPGVAWEACGEFGEETRYVCIPCQGPNFKPQASNGSNDPRWCGIIAPAARGR